MAQSNLIAIDLAKNIFQVAQFQGSKLKSNKQASRRALLELLVKAKPSVVAMEACASAQYFARTAQSFGHKVMLLDPLFVKAFRQGQKTDANDAIAIAIASKVPNVRTCKILSIEEQALQSAPASQLPSAPPHDTRNSRVVITLVCVFHGRHSRYF